MIQRTGNIILLTVPIPEFKSLLLISHNVSHITKIEIRTPGTMVKIPEMESVELSTLFEKNKSGFAPQAFVKLKTR